MPGSYTTRAGDEWDAIAYREYGDERYMHLLLDANPDHNYTTIFDSGVVLVVPDMPTPAPPSTLPPWRRPA